MTTTGMSKTKAIVIPHSEWYYLEGCAKKTERTFYFIAFLLLKIMLLPLCVLKDGTLGILKWQIGSI